MGTLLKGGTLIELEPASVEVAALRVEDGKIVSRGADAVHQPGDEIIDLHGKLVLPGLISAHHHLYSTLMRGAPREGGGFGAEQQVQHHLEDALDLEAVQAAAAAGGLEGLMYGTTAVFDLHASPNAPHESLSRVAHGLSDIGLRAVLSYAVSERRGPKGRDEGLEETVAFLKRARGRIRGAFGVYGIDDLSDEGVAALREAWQPSGALLQLHVGEDPLEESRSKARFKLSPFERLRDAGLIGERTVLAQGVHLSWPDLSEVLDLGAWMAHCPRSNMASQTGTAAAAKFGVRGCIGTDTQSLDVLAEAQAAWLRARDAGQPIDVLRYLANGHRLATAAFGAPLGPLRAGALADLVIFDYRPPAPLNAQTLSAHVLNGLSSRHVESVMVDGLWRLWGRKPLAVKPEDVAGTARHAAQATWARMAELGKVVEGELVEAEPVAPPVEVQAT
ncbi:MAG: amidohydrolase family protein [Archangiaceae bacterium]|nr:amidohydrolase family protein [Archangiaceae bacterium]